jgi:acetylornithine deacetylase/succinyl-diaminopimelate desuccinylase-like protein
VYAILRSKVEGLKQELVAFARELVRTPSPSFEEAAVARLIEAQMRRAGYDKVFNDEFGNVLGILFGRESTPTALLNCHMDTVPPCHEGPWDESPYSGCVKNGRLCGVGSADCKGGAAAHIFVGALLRRSLLPLRGNLVVAATVGEENGRSAGVRGLIEKTLPELHLRPDFAILGEPTGLGLYYGHDGWLQLEVRVAGSNPFHVEDAAHAIFSDFDSSCCEGGQGRPFETATVYPPCFEDGSGIRRATIRMDRRLRLHEDVGEVINQMRHNASLIAQPIGAIALDVAIRQENRRLYTGRTTLVRHITNAWSTDPFCRLMDRARQSLAAAGCEVRPGRWQLGRLGMGTAGSMLVKEFDVPTIGYGPGKEDVAHASGEYVEIDKIIEAAYGTTAIVHSLIGVPVCGWTSDEI